MRAEHDTCYHIPRIQANKSMGRLVNSPPSFTVVFVAFLVPLLLQLKLLLFVTERLSAVLGRQAPLRRHGETLQQSYYTLHEVSMSTARVRRKRDGRPIQYGTMIIRGTPIPY